MDSETLAGWKTRGLFSRRLTLLGTNISPEKSILKMIFLFPRWDMLISWRVKQLLQLPCMFLGMSVVGCWPPEPARGCQLNNHVPTIIQGRWEPSRGKMETPKETREVCEPTIRGNSFADADFFACLIPHIYLVTLSVLRVVLFLGRVDTVPPEEKEKNCEAHGPAFEYNAATGSTCSRKKKRCNSATVKREVGLVPWWKSYVYVSLKQVKTRIPT